MIVLKDGEQLYLRNWEYNACRITSALAVIVENNGGTVKPNKKPVIINRTLLQAIRELEDKVKQIDLLDKPLPERQEAYAAKQRKQLEELSAINNEPLEVTHTGYITFILDDMYYYYEVSDNPFFPFHYIKTPIVNGRYSRDAALEEDPKEWLYDCFFSFNVSEADIKEAANLIFNMLMNAKKSTVIRDGKRTRVPNTYNSGYHYETVYAPERWERVEEWNK